MANIKKGKLRKFIKKQPRKTMVDVPDKLSKSPHAKTPNKWGTDSTGIKQHKSLESGPVGRLMDKASKLEQMPTEVEKMPAHTKELDN